MLVILPTPLKLAVTFLRYAGVFQHYAEAGHQVRSPEVLNETFAADGISEVETSRLSTMQEIIDGEKKDLGDGTKSLLAMSPVNPRSKSTSRS